MKEFEWFIPEIRGRILNQLRGSEFEDIYTYLFHADSAKFLRPLIFYIIAKSNNKNDHNKILDLAAAIEMIHVASLIHDDVNDCATKRRDLMSLNIKFGTDIAVLAGDYIFTKAINILVKFDNLAILEVISQSVSNMTEGQIKDTLVKYPSEEEYLEIVEAKTASLFMCSAKLGAMLALKNKKTINALANYGKLFGMAFQISDDIFDEDKNIPFLKGEAELKVKYFIDKAKEELNLISKPNHIRIDLLIELADRVVSSVC